MANNPIIWRVKINNILYDIRSLIEHSLGALAMKDKATLTNASDVEGTLPVANGGTGRTTLTANRILTGAGTNAVGMIQTQNGAFYATGDNATAKFGILPAAQGGTGNENGNIPGNAATATKLASARTLTVALNTDFDSENPVQFDGSASKNLPVNGTLAVKHGGTGRATLTANRILTGAGTSAVGMIQTQSGAFYATAEDSAAKFGTLPIAQGGTNATSASQARTNLGVVQTSYDTFSGTALTAESNIEYSCTSSSIGSLTITWPSGGTARGTIFGVNFKSTSSFSGVTFTNTSKSVKLVGDALSINNKKYNLICWYDGSEYWCAAKAA